jgi:hypothetical protein
MSLRSFSPAIENFQEVINLLKREQWNVLRLHTTNKQKLQFFTQQTFTLCKIDANWNPFGKGIHGCNLLQSSLF